MRGKSFAEQIIDSMVDENGHCGERGLSPKQFAILAKCLEEGETKNCGGAYNRTFTSTDFTGVIGRYEVHLNEFYHFNPRYTVVSIDTWIDEVPDTSDSQWVGEDKERIERVVTYLGCDSYERRSFSGYGTDTVNIHRFADAEGNLLIWKTTAYLTYYDDTEDNWLTFYAGDRLILHGTVKSHDEYRGTKQTILNRCKAQLVKDS